MASFSATVPMSNPSPLVITKGDDALLFGSPGNPGQGSLSTGYSYGQIWPRGNW